MEDAAEARERENLSETHQLADSTFRNIGEFMEELKTLVTAAKAYHKSLQNMTAASDHFFTTLEFIGIRTAKLPGSVRKLGTSMLDIVTSHRYAKDSHMDWIQSLDTDFIVPMEKKLRDEKKNAKNQHDMYRAENIKRTIKLKRTHKMVKKASKKRTPSRDQVQKILQLKHMFEEDKDMLYSTRVEGLRKALLEERKLYCFCIDHFCSVLRNQIAYNSESHRVFSTQVNDWSSVCSSPNELPPESSALLIQLRSTRVTPSSGLVDGHQHQSSNHQQGSMLADALRPARQRRVGCRVKALYPYHNTTGEEQLDFKPGDLIDAIDEEQEGWQYGENTRTGGMGWFPAIMFTKYGLHQACKLENRQIEITCDDINNTTTNIDRYNYKDKQQR